MFKLGNNLLTFPFDIFMYLIDVLLRQLHMFGCHTQLFTGQLQLCPGFLQFFLNRLFFNLKPHGARQINLILQRQLITLPTQKGLLSR